MSSEPYDAIVIGGGHNGLVNGAYLARGGMRTLILEQREMVGGAAITEELRPGFWFTTFSYALSLLRPEIVQELELVKHGFMPLLMSSTFAPMENGDYLLLGQDHGENQQEIARHSRHDADAYDRFDHDLNKVLQAFKPLMDAPPPNLFSDDPEELLALAGLGARFKALPKDVLHNAVRLLTGSAADFLDDYFESDILKGYLASSSIIGTRIGPRSQGSGLVLLYHLLGEHDGIMGAWSFHKGGNGGFTKVLRRAAEAFGAEVRVESPVFSRSSLMMSILRGSAYQDDVVDLLAHPIARIKNVRQADKPHSRSEYKGRDYDLVGTSYDASTGQVTFAPKLTEAQRLGFRKSLIQPSQSDTEYSLKLQRDWIPRIVDRYSDSPTEIVLTALPRGPFLKLGGLSKGYDSVLPTSVIKKTSFSLPGHTFEFLEKPEYYFDAFHLNAKGRQKFTETLVSEVLGRLRSADSKPQRNSGSHLAVHGPPRIDDAN